MSYDLVDAITQAAQKAVRRQLGNVVSPFIYATFIEAEAVDANLSIIQQTDGSEARFVPKGAHVTGLTEGDTILCIKGKGVPLTILMKVVGDITLAAIDPDETE